MRIQGGAQVDKVDGTAQIGGDQELTFKCVGEDVRTNTGGDSFQLRI